MNQRKQNLLNTGNAIVRITTVRSCRKNSSRIWSAVKLSASAKSGPRASHLAPKTIDKQRMRVTSSFLFVRRSTQSYDELLAAVPIRPRPCMMLGMINTSDILSIGENAHACNSSVAGDPSASAANNSSLPSRFLQEAVEVSSLRRTKRIEFRYRSGRRHLCCAAATARPIARAAASRSTRGPASFMSTLSPAASAATDAREREGPL